MSNVSLIDDIVGTLMLPFNMVSTVSSYLANHVRVLSIDPYRIEYGISDGKRTARLEIRQGRSSSSGTVSWTYSGKRLVFNYTSKKELVDVIRMVKSEFLLEESGWLGVKGKKVLDIGGYTGDTAIYFALNGAKHVFALEPYPYFYNLARKNVLSNRLGSKITMVNAGVGRKNSHIRVDSDADSFSSSSFKAGKRMKSVPIMSLGEIVRKYRLDDAALKMDCEGYEYETILESSDETLRKFSEMEIEYHYGYLNLQKRLIKAGFKVTVKRPMKRYNFGTGTVMVNGFMHAKRS
ncbi:MAG: FkbM family methyltransferase [Candidatus Micrarchaeota archaeon]|nr:FkbM family methyltransferase [Candidatus Micrarchaeota archaeon]